MARAPAPPTRIDLRLARAWWHRRVGLAEPVPGTLAEVVAATGWPRTLGGVDVYLALRARVPGMRRAHLDAAVERRELQVIPAVRGCIYLVPAAEAPVVLRVAEESWRQRSDRELEKLGVPPSEVEAVAEAALVALERGPLGPDALRRAMPPSAVRSLGEAGKKLGIASPLPTALRQLEFQGRLERTVPGGRLDTERYEWRIPARNPFADADVPEDPIARLEIVGRVFFRHAAPATLKDFAAWAALSQRDARIVMERLPLVPVAVEGYAPDAFVLADDLDALQAFEPDAPGFSLLPFEDNYLTWHRGTAPIVDPAHHTRPITPWGATRPVTLADARHISMRGVLEGDMLAGLWEFDPETGEIVHAMFDGRPRAEALDARARDLAEFFRADLGHARSFSLDTTEEVRKRAALVREMAGTKAPA